MTEQRISPRQRVLKAGTIAFGGAAIDCTIRNLSGTGACLEVASPLGIPPLFTLVVETGHSKRTCAAVWRTENRIGVTFA